MALSGFNPSFGMVRKTWRADYRAAARLVGIREAATPLSRRTGSGKDLAAF